MSMSQEEIEALMSGGGDFTADDDSQDNESVEEVQSDDIQDSENNDDPVDTEDQTTEENFDDILAGIEGITEDDSQLGEEENFDDILAGIDGITEDKTPSSSSEETKESSKSSMEELIEQSKYPLPVEKEHKVVNQLNEVAADSEQKASQIFDVLSYILDENNEISSFHKKSEEFLSNQVELLEALSNKFPNIAVFKENLETGKELVDSSKVITSKIDSENMKIFEAMELMQYHDINRQKIERVMSVIKKLNDYLNGIFEDDSDRPEVQIAKHISGDNNETVEADDLEALISEFAAKE